MRVCACMLLYVSYILLYICYCMYVTVFILLNVSYFLYLTVRILLYVSEDQTRVQSMHSLRPEGSVNQSMKSRLRLRFEPT